MKSTITNETHEQYLQSDGLSYSGLKLFSKTPAHFRAGFDDEESAARRLGTIVHMAILEPDRFETEVLVNDAHRNSNAFKEFKALADEAGKIVVKTDERNAAAQMRDRVLSVGSIKRLLSQGKAEQSLRWQDPESKVLCKCRPDYLRNDGIVVDVKTYSDLSVESLERQIWNMKYHWQSAFYLEGVKHTLGIETNMFAHLFVDVKAMVPRVIVLDDAALEKAWFEMRPLIQRFAECLEKNEWPGYPDEVVTVGLPSYAW